ncbi:MAG TPA: 6-bladed beta-propeller [Gaiellaceae bacterium]|nr:6-bladed beta-propeller [Gaiellaceae bacterium]
MNGGTVSMIAAALVTGATLVAGATASSEATTAGTSYKVVGKWGKDGSGNSQFNNPNGIAVSKAGNVYVADTDNNRVQVFSKSGAYLRKWGSNGPGNGQFKVAEDVEIAPDGTVWVADQQNQRLQAFSATGGFQSSIELGELPRAVGVAADGSVLAAANGEERSGFRRWVERSGSWDAAGGLFGAGEYRADEVEGSPDGTIYLVTSRSTPPYDARIRRFTADGKALGSFKRGDSTTTPGIGVDLDCNVWSPDHPQRRIVKYSPSGKVLATASSPDLIARDIAIGPTGDLYVIAQNAGIVRFAEDKSKPATANVPAAIKVSGRTAKIAYTLSGVACPKVVGATATLTGRGVAGKAAGLKLKAGAKNTITMKLSKAASGKATFKIVLKTNGRPTTETKSVTVNAR